MTELKITFLGTGTSQGIPLIACDCPVCLSSDPRDQRSRASLLVESPDTAWVIDTGPDFRSQCLREKTVWLDAAIYTHSHTDHIMGFDDLRQFCHLRPEGSIPVYATPDVLKDLARVFEFAFNGKNHFPGYVIPDPHTIDGPFTLGKIELTPFQYPHGRTEVTGFLHSYHGEKLFAYVTDCKTIPEQHHPLLHKVDTLIIDALRDRPHPTHLSISEALDLVEKLQPRQTFFTHICHEVPHQQTQEKMPENVFLAYDGLKLTFPLPSN